MRIVASEGVRVDATVSNAPIRFEEFFQALAPTLFRRLYLITGDPSEAEEILQDAFIAVFERWDRVRDMDDPVGYLYRVAFNIQRKRRRRATMAVRRSLGFSPPADEFAALENRTLIAAAPRN